MSLQPPTGNTRRIGGPTSGVNAGPSRRTGQMMGTRTRRTGGMTTSGTGREPEDNEYVIYNGARIYVKPKPLMIRHSDNIEKKPLKDTAGGMEESQSGASQQALDSNQSKDPNVDKPKGSDEQKKTDDKTGDKKSIDGTSQLTSSLVEGTSDDEAAKKQKEQEAKKAKSKQLTADQLEEMIDVTLAETNTITLLMIPGTVVNNDTPQERESVENNKAYKELKQNKIGSDLYNQRGSQTLNAAQKQKGDNFTGFSYESKEVVATKWSIDDASKMQKLSESKVQEIAYKKSIEDIMVQKLKQPNSLFDAESLASHISIMTSNAAQSESRASSNKPGRKPKGSQLTSSKSGIKQSRDDATSDQNSNMSGSQAEAARTSQGITSTVGGDNKTFKAKDVQYVEEELPDSMMNAIRIIERLLTQLKFHEEQVLYKAYPSADVKKGMSEEEENRLKQEQDQGLFGGFGGGDKKEEKKEEEVEEEIDPDDHSVTPLFKFKCDKTDHLPVSCIDINTVNDDLIAVGYGEFDILYTKELKKGILAFWTLKNPSLPEKIIYHEHSITCCAWSKTQPYLIAVGDSQGNIAIYNVRAKDYQIPIADSRDDGGKHTDIVWEVQWVDKGTKGEYLVSISGDGRVIEWSMKKGLELTELTQLKRETNPNQKDVYSSAAADDKEKKGAMIFITTGGLSMDFPTGEGESGGTYFVATEDCSIHRCSVSYPDSYGDNYYGHMGPIYRVRCNPYWHPSECPVFISCSYDWTVKIWHANEQKELLNCHQVTESKENPPLKEQVNDVMWSPDTSTCFASVADDGRLEIWDLYIDYLKPVVTHFDRLPKKEKKEEAEVDDKGKAVEEEEEDPFDHTPKTVVRFTPKFSKMSPVILTGNKKGEVDVYRTRGFEHKQVQDQDQWNRLFSALKKDDFSADKDGKEAEAAE